MGAAAAGRGRGAAEFAAALPLSPALGVILGGCADLLASLGFEVTTIFFGAGCVLFSPSRALLEPAISDDESPLAADSSFPVFALLCFLFDDAEALSMILWANSLLEEPPFLRNLGRILLRLVFCNSSSSTVTKRSSSYEKSEP